jgi:hypothetical protein
MVLVGVRGLFQRGLAGSRFLHVAGVRLHFLFEIALEVVEAFQLGDGASESPADLREFLGAKSSR